MEIYKVGGAVRDSLMGVVPSDIDWVVVGSSPEAVSYTHLTLPTIVGV